VRGEEPRAEPIRVILALGSNLGERRDHLTRGLGRLARELTIRAVSRVVESEPWGPVEQNDFLNLVVRAETGLPPLSLLELLQEVERAEGRMPSVPMGPRTLDVDLVFYGREIIVRPELQVPHPHWRQRPFVAEILADVVDDMRDPHSGRLIRELVPATIQSSTLRVVEPLGWLSADTLEASR
jgi:2-amino-4-hydroxy-6-hydroxymethyldihydropteridine diphosphokinase